ncbi:MAG: alpha/beta hydrolase [Oscillospiraceae bacterium]|nr:alpha/beta hydrolase [Oscillospiraceae bacterium]
MREVYFDLPGVGASLCCKRYEPEGEVRRVILGVHGFCGGKDSLALRLLAEETAACGAALVCFDLPAHGMSPEQADALTVERCKSDLLRTARWMEQRWPGAERAVFATSFGGYIALQCLGGLPGWQCVLRAPAVTMPQVLLDLIAEGSAQRFREQGVIRCGFERMIDLPYTFYEDLVRHNIAGLAVDRPILVFQGDADEVVPPADVQAYCAARPQMELRVVPGADHRFMGEGQLARVVQETRDWLGWGLTSPETSHRGSAAGR